MLVRFAVGVAFLLVYVHSAAAQQYTATKIDSTAPSDGVAAEIAALLQPLG
jgi:hypothetical protein